MESGIGMVLARSGDVRCGRAPPSTDRHPVIGRGKSPGVVARLEETQLACISAARAGSRGGDDRACLRRGR